MTADPSDLLGGAGRHRSASPRVLTDSQPLATRCSRAVRLDADVDDVTRRLPRDNPRRFREREGRRRMRESGVGGGDGASEPSMSPCTEEAPVTPGGSPDVLALILRWSDGASEVDPDRVWDSISPRLRPPAPDTQQRGVRLALLPWRGLQRTARFASITGAGWGGPITVALFAALVVLSLLVGDGSAPERPMREVGGLGYLQTSSDRAVVGDRSL